MSAPEPQVVPTFSPRVVAALAIAVALAVGGLAVLSTFHDQLGGGLRDNGDSNAVSRSAIGYAGLIELLNDSGRRAFLSRDPDSVDTPAGLLILAPPPASDLAKAVKAIKFDGPRLVVTDKWLAARDRKIETHVDKVRLLDADEREQTFGDLDHGLQLHTAGGTSTHTLTVMVKGPLQGLQFTTGPIESWQTFAPSPDLTPVLQDEAGNLVIAGVGKDLDYFLLSDPDLLANHGLKDAQGATAALAIIDGMDSNHRGVAFDVSLNGFGAAKRGLAKALLSPPLLPATLCLVLAAIMVAAHAFGRFGPARPAGRVFGFGKRALADNTAGLIRLAHRERSAAAPYAALTRDLALEAVGAPRELAGAEADAFLDRLGATRGVDTAWTTLKSEAEHGGNADELLRSARRLRDWLDQLRHEKRT